MVTVLSGGTGSPKLLAGSDAVFPAAETTVVANTGDDVAIGGLLVCPDVDTVCFLGGDELDREAWWGIDGDTTETHDELQRLATAADLSTGPTYLPEAVQTEGPRWARWRRFAGYGEFMTIGDRDRAIHLTRTGLLRAGRSLTEVTATLADALDVPWTVRPMSDDPVATMVETPAGSMHFQSFWVAHDAEPPVENVHFRGADAAEATAAVLAALDDQVIVGPSNPVTSIGPMLAIDGIADALDRTPVVAVSPFVEDRVFSGPAGKLMAATGLEPSTAGVAEAYPFADAFVLDEADGTTLDRPVVRTDTRMDDPDDAARVARACRDALEAVS